MHSSSPDSLNSFFVFLGLKRQGAGSMSNGPDLRAELVKDAEAPGVFFSGSRRHPPGFMETERELPFLGPPVGFPY